MDNLTRLALLVNKIAGLRNEQTIGAITPPRVADILDMLVMFANNGEIPTTDIPGADEISDEDAQAIEEMFSKVEVDRVNKLLRVKDHDDIFVCPVEQLLAPAAPTYGGTAYPSTSPLVSTANSQSISLTNNATGSTIMWTILAENGDTSSTDSQPQDPRDAASSPSTGTSVTLQNILDNETRTYKIWAVAKKNGMFNNATNDLKITIVAKRKVATPTFQGASGTDWDLQRTRGISCTTSGATIRHTVDGTTIPTTTVGTEGSTATLTATGYVKAIAYKTGWIASDVATSSQVIVAAPKCYIGQAASISSISDIKALANSYDRYTLVGQTVPTINFGSTTQYVWFCMPFTTSKNLSVQSEGVPVPLNDPAGTVIGNTYRVWRTDNKINSSFTFKFE